jgi:hypothetical protein
VCFALVCCRLVNDPRYTSEATVRGGLSTQQQYHHQPQQPQSQSQQRSSIDDSWGPSLLVHAAGKKTVLFALFLY